MGIKELLEKIKLVDIQLQLKDFFKGKHIGLININLEKTYNINLSNSEFWEKFALAKITPEIENIARQKAAEKLEPISSELDILPVTISVNVATTAMATQAMTAIGFNPKVDDDI